MPDVSLCSCSDDRAAGCGLLAKVMDPGLPFFTWCLVPTREVGWPHVRDLPPPLAPHWKPGALRVQLEQGTASSNTLTAVLPRGQDRVGDRRNCPGPQLLGFSRRGPASVTLRAGRACSALRVHLFVVITFKPEYSSGSPLPGDCNPVSEIVLVAQRLLTYSSLGVQTPSRLNRVGRPPPVFVHEPHHPTSIAVNS